MLAVCYVCTCIDAQIKECSAEGASEDLPLKAEETAGQACDCVGSPQELGASGLYIVSQHGLGRIATPPIPKAGSPG